jgi:hypothetical protein
MGARGAAGFGARGDAGFGAGGVVGFAPFDMGMFLDRGGLCCETI